MTTVATKVVRCRLCRKKSEQVELVSTNSFGSPDLDLRPPEMQRSTMWTWLQQCPECGHSAPDISQRVSEAYRAAIQDRRYPELARRFLTYAVAISSSDPSLAARAYLHAAWVCDDAALSEQAVEARQHAAEWFRRLQPFPDTEQGRVAGAQFVDVLRRAGQFPAADAECTTLLGREGWSGTARQVLLYQQRLIAAGDVAAHTIAECETA